ncbi:MAG: hypothetical protein WKG32_09430 [Gemmatimonadaceae bacterium]
MPPLTTRETTQRLIAREQASGRAPRDATASAERVVRRLSDELARWFGPYGARALLTRALDHARAEHPALAGVRVGQRPVPALDGLADSAHGGAAAAVEVLAALVALLERLIGDELATNLVEQSMRNGSTDAPTQGGGVEGGAAGDRGASDGADTFGDTTGSTRDD